MKTEDYLQHNFRDLGGIEDIFAGNRRDFLKRVGGGIVIFMAIQDALFGQEGAPARNRMRAPSDFNAYLRIGEDGRVTCLTGKIEMGQGIITSLPQMLAEELEVPLAQVDIKLGDTAVEFCPEIPWREVRGLGNRLRHDYDSIDIVRIWLLLERDLPTLKAACQSALRTLGQGEASC